MPGPIFTTVNNYNAYIQLQLYAERGKLNSSNLILRDTYQAKAYNNESLTQVIKEDNNRIQNIIICTAVFVIFFSLVIFGLMFCAFCCSKSHTESKWVSEAKNKPETVISLAVVSFILNIYIIAVASSAVEFWREKLDNELQIYHDIDALRSQNLASICTALAFDNLCFIVLISIVIIAVYLKFKECKCPKCDICSKCNKNTQVCRKCTTACRKDEYLPDINSAQEHCKCTRLKSKAYAEPTVILSLTVFCPMFCIIAHSPYIAVAYLNDGNHASSIFIYYSILIYVFFGLIWLFVHWCQHQLYPKEEVVEGDSTAYQNAETDELQPTEETVEDDGTPDPKKETGKYCCCIKQSNFCCIKKCKDRCCTVKTLIIIFLFFAILFLLGIAVLIACYLVLIPINMAVSNAPSRVLSIYQSGGFLIGSIIVYKVIDYFYNKKKEEEDEKEKKKEIVYDIFRNFYDEMIKNPKYHETAGSPA